MPFFSVFRPARPHTVQARLQRARNEGYTSGAQQAKLFRLAGAGVYQREQALDWLGAAIDEGRAQLQDQHALEREIEAWDMSCRIMFMVQISG